MPAAAERRLGAGAAVRAAGALPRLQPRRPRRPERVPRGVPAGGRRARRGRRQRVARRGRLVQGQDERLHLEGVELLAQNEAAPRRPQEVMSWGEVRSAGCSLSSLWQ